MEIRTVFISYAREDEDLVLPVVRLLRAAGATVFVDIEDIPYGGEWHSILLERLRDSERILVFWSANASRSDWVRREYLCAISEGLRVVPVPLDDTPLPAELSVYQALMTLVPLVYKAGTQLRPSATRTPWTRFAGLGMALIYLLIGSSVILSPEGASGSLAWIPAVATIAGVVLVLLPSQRSRIRVSQEASLPTLQGASFMLQSAIYETVFGDTTKLGS